MTGLDRAVAMTRGTRGRTRLGKGFELVVARPIGVQEPCNGKGMQGFVRVTPPLLRDCDPGRGGGEGTRGFRHTPRWGFVAEGSQPSPPENKGPTCERITTA